MKKKLVFFNSIILLIALILMFVLGILVTKNNQINFTEEKIKQITEIYVDNYNIEKDFSKKFDDNIRITILDSNCNVISDTDADSANLENHLDRDEIQAAIKGTPKVVIRKSNTLKIDMMYYAEKVDINEGFIFIRTAIPVANINDYVLQTIPLSVAILFFSIIISILVSIFLSGEFLKPFKKVEIALNSLSNGEYEKIFPFEKDEELNNMILEINNVGENLKNIINFSKEEKERLDYILNNISDGIIVLDKELNIITINQRAESIFSVRKSEGKNIYVLTSEKKLLLSIDDCVNSKNGTMFQIKLFGEWYLITINYTEHNLIIIVLTNITADKNNENMRLEFFANVSHELKTPLTTIKGFNEMILLNKNLNPTIKNYSEKIEKETFRMVSLIDDMLNLSKLENKEIKKELMTKINLREVSLEIVEELKIIAKDKNVLLTVVGEGSICAEKEHIYELIKNLIENAIKYNVQNGTVEVKILGKEGKVLFIVKDSGIGIDRENQTRIFERFYRVDKSRSRATGGTGLGLSIVKHIAEIYHAEIILQSKIGLGTSIFISFPKEKV